MNELRKKYTKEENYTMARILNDKFEDLRLTEQDRQN